MDDEKWVYTLGIQKNLFSKLQTIVVAFVYFVAIELISQIILLQTGDLYIQYNSDLNLHIQNSLDGVGAYSLISEVYKVLTLIFHNQISIAIFLICLIFLGVYVTSWYIKKVAQIDNWSLCLLVGLFVYSSAALYVPSFNSYRYIGLYMAGVWHNSTLFGIKLVGVLQVFFLHKIAARFQLEHKTSIKVLVCVAFVGVLSAWLKPNLDLALYPALAIMLIIWFIQGRGKWFKPLVEIACTVIPTFAVLFWQSEVVFDGGVSSSFAIKPFFIMSQWVSNIPVAALQSFAFPLAVLVLGWTRLKKMDSFAFVWLGSIIAYMQYALLVEPGDRMMHGNWGWGILVMTFLLFLVSAECLLSNTKGLWNQRGWKKYWLVICYGLFLLHAWYGYEYLMYYFTTGNYI